VYNFPSVIEQVRQHSTTLKPSQVSTLPSTRTASRDKST